MRWILPTHHLVHKCYPKIILPPKTNITIILPHPKPVVKCDGGDAEDETSKFKLHPNYCLQAIMLLLVGLFQKVQNL